MTLRDYIPVDKEDLPVYFEYDFGDTTYNLGFNYNVTHDFFTIDIYDDAFNPIVLGEKLIYGKQLWSGIVNAELPSETLIPFDESGQETEITYDNFGETVFLFIDDIDLADLTSPSLATDSTLDIPSDDEDGGNDDD